MLFDEISVPEIVDRECASEFLKEATRLASSDELRDTGDALAEKSVAFQRALSKSAIDTLDHDGLLALVDRMFLVRRKRRVFVKHVDLRAVADLLHGEDALRDRFDRFVSGVKGLDQPLAIAFASELLHFTDPARHWLWTPWVWDPKTGAGALPLVLNGDKELRGATPGDTYARVGLALDALERELVQLGEGRFGTDVYLAAVYAVYMFTVFRMRLSKEFNRLLPELPELTRRILGVHRNGERPRGGKARA